MDGIETSPTGHSQVVEAGTATNLAEQVRHPLDPLTPNEIATVTRVVRAAPEFGEDVFFETMELKEPAKAVVRGFKAGDPITRQAQVALFRHGGVGVWRLIISLDDETIVENEFLPEACPMIQGEEFTTIDEMVKSHPDFIEACRKRGIEDMTHVCVDPWSGGRFGVAEEDGRHFCYTFSWMRTRENDNLYAHPIEGLNAVVDIKTGEMVRIDDHEIVPVPMMEHNYDRLFQEHVRDDLKPINVTQPEGVSFSLEGNRLKWHEWSLLVGFNAREALVIYDISYGGRPVVYRASLSEMVVPYGSPENGHYRKSVFDVGEYGIGKLANSLELGCDCLGSIQYLDAHLNDMYGGICTIPKAICIHEEDNGILWKHWDFRTERTENRRARKLVVSSIATVGNYEYALYWYFHLDGMIEFEIKATGSLNTVARHPGDKSKYAQEVAPGVFGQIHQHLFCARIDMAVDGDENSVVECNTYAEPPGDTNPYGNAFYQEDTVLKTETVAARLSEPASQRYWKFINPNKTNYLGDPVGYKLDAPNCVTPFMAPDSPSGTRAGFTYNHLWVTAHDQDERYPAGEYMNHSDGSGGLPAFVADDASVENTDIVAWHVFGLHHQPRPEDFPLQSCISAGFKLMPTGFFDRNPCLDLPYEGNETSCCADAAVNGHAGE